MLSRWPSVNRHSDDLQLSYRSTDDARVTELAKVVQDVTEPVARKLVDFLVLDPGRIRLLSGKDVEESDVPIWEHRKRDHRYAIRPLIRLDGGQLVWGAAAASRAHDIWAGSFAGGYPPADLPWPHVEVSALIKRRTELELETRAFEICRRYATYVQQGINFKHRFPKESYEDVGDFDALVYCPERSFWLTIECKYNSQLFALRTPAGFVSTSSERRRETGSLGRSIGEGNFLWPKPSA